jgi:hypothetical protein
LPQLDPFCPGNRFKATVAIDANQQSAQLQVSSNWAGGDMLVAGDRGVTAVSHNVVKGTLRCVNDPELVWSGGNWAGHLVGQCHGRTIP